MSNLLSSERAFLVCWRIHHHHVLMDREEVAVRLDLRADVVPSGVNGNGGNGPPIALTAENDS